MAVLFIQYPIIMIIFSIFGIQSRPVKDPDGVLSALTRDCGVLAQKDPLIWNWPVLSHLFMVRI